MGGARLGPELVASPVSGGVSGLWLVDANGVTRNGSTTGQANALLTGAAVLSASFTYRLKFTLADFSGDSFGFRFGAGTARGPVAANGSYTFDFPGGGATGLIFIPWGGVAGQATITAMSLRRVLR
jgi:hypothetical protein